MPAGALSVPSSHATGHTTLTAPVKTNPAQFAAYISSDAGRRWTHRAAFV